VCPRNGAVDVSRRRCAKWRAICERGLRWILLGPFGPHWLLLAVWSDGCVAEQIADKRPGGGLTNNSEFNAPQIEECRGNAIAPPGRRRMGVRLQRYPFATQAIRTNKPTHGTIEWTRAR